MSFKFHTFRPKNFSARDFLSKFKENNIQNDNFNEISIRSVQLTNDIEKNKKIKKILVEKNLEEELSSNKANNDDAGKKNIENKSNDIKEIINLMLLFNCYLPDEIKIDNYDRSKNDIEFSNIISCFQLIIKFLFEKKENSEEQNNLMEKTILLNKDEVLSKNKEIIQKNNQEINRLENKKMKLQMFLKKYGKGEDLESKRMRFYVCDVCPYPYQYFYSYKEFHKHYVKNHINPSLSLSSEYTILNQGFDKSYFDKKINELSEDVTQAFKETKMGDNINNINFPKNDNSNNIITGIRRNKRYDTFTKNNNIGMDINNNSNDNSEIRKEIIKKRLESIETNQKNFEKNFKIQMNSFLEEIKKEILNIKKNQLIKNQ